jgi:hypothetical protein
LTLVEVPNITLDKKNGIGKWNQSDLVEYLETGAMPDGDYVGNDMAQVIDNSLSHLTKDDRKTIAIYVMPQPSVESVAHERKPRQKKPKTKNDSSSGTEISSVTVAGLRRHGPA